MLKINGLLSFGSESDSYYLNILKQINKENNFDNEKSFNNLKNNNNKKFLININYKKPAVHINSKKYFQDENKNYLIVLNGNIYNLEAIKKELKLESISYKNYSEVEVFLEGYKRFGRNILSKINGKFVVIIFDFTNNILFIAKDRIGDKNLYYTYNKNFFAFSSELKSLISYKKKINFEMDEVSLFDFLSFGYVSEGNTLIKQIKKIENGCYIEIINNKISKPIRYFSYNVAPEEYENIEIYNKSTNYLFELIKKSIDTKIDRNSTTGILLSGDINSSLISAIVYKELNLKLDTFSIVFKDSDEQNLNFSKEVSEILGLSHDNIVVDKNMIKNMVYNFENIIDEPNGNINTFLNFLFLIQLRKKVDVVLSGDGGDELFGGNNEYWNINNLFNSDNTDNKLNNSLNEYFYNSFKSFNVNQLCLNFPHLKKNFYNKYLRYFMNNQRSIGSSMKNFYFDNFLPRSLLSFNNSFYQNNIDIRMPFLDNRIIDYSKNIPDSLMWNGKHSKLILRKICSKYFPEYIFFQNKKENIYNKKIVNIISDDAELNNHLDEIYQNSNFFSGEKNIYKFIKKESFFNKYSYWNYMVLAKWLNSLKINI